MSTVSPNLRSMQSEVASLQRQILSVGGPKLSKIQSKIDSLTAQLDTFSSSLSTKSVEEANCRKQAEKAGSLRIKAEQEMVKAEAKLADLIKQQKEMEADAMEVINAVEAAKALMVGLEEQLQGSSKEFHDLKALVGKIKNVELDLTVEMERVSHELKESKATAKKWFQEAEAVRRQHLEEQKEFLAVVRSVVPVMPASVSAATSNSTSSPMKISGGGGEALEEDSSSSAVNMSVDGDKEQKEDDELEVLPILSAEELMRSDVDEVKKDINAMEILKNK